MDDSVKIVLDNVVRNRNGKLLLYQCHPTIFHRRAKSVSRANFDNLTVIDILQQLRKTKQMIHTVLKDH